MSSHFTEKFHVVQIQQPVCIIDHKRFSIRKINKTLHLFFEAVDIMLNCFLCHHLTHIGSSGGITDHSGSAAKKCDGTVSCHLKTLHQAKRHKVSYMKAVCSGVKANIKSGFSIIYHPETYRSECQMNNKQKTYCFTPSVPHLHTAPCRLPRMWQADRSVRSEDDPHVPLPSER